MIHGGGSIHLSTAASVVPSEYIEAHRPKGMRHASYIGAVTVALQSMRDNYQFFPRSSYPVEVQKVSIRGGDAFPVVGLGQLHRSEQGGVNGGKVPIPHQKRGSVVLKFLVAIWLHLFHLNLVYPVHKQKFKDLSKESTLYENRNLNRNFYVMNQKKNIDKIVKSNFYKTRLIENNYLIQKTTTVFYFPFLV